ncbi:FecR domain-containing protein [Novosphingobium sp. BL-8H]|uniref:FecR family protein n=1 Tax=Novosphingobium sp. BL-8H TaxID=3127640 RepID=UPI0037567E2E
MNLEQDANDWFAQMRGPEASEAQDAFAAWYAVPQHAQAYDRRARLWDATKFLTNTPTGKARDLDLAKPRSSRRPVWGMAAATLGGLVIATLAVGTVWRMNVAPSEPVRTEMASLEEAPRTLTLADGSTLILDRGARLQIAFKGKERRLRLLTGRARFSVAHDRSRPFVVETGAGSVTAHGTLFDVDLAQGSMRVGLLEGAVEVRSRPGGQGRGSIELKAGQQVAVKDGVLGETGKIASVDREWPNDMLVITGMDIGDAVSAFNRTASVPVSFDVRSTRSLRVTGAFKRSDPHLFASQLAQTFGLAVETREDGSLALVDRSHKNFRLP